MTNGRVCVFIYRNRSGCVWTIYYNVALADAGLPHNRRHFICDIEHLAATFGAQTEIFLNDFHSKDYKPAVKPPAKYFSSVLLNTTFAQRL
jgi:hypothetical protein